MSSKADDSCGRGEFAGVSAIVFANQSLLANRCSAALRARPKAIEILLRLGREIDVPGK
jgi:hypothetical protein